MQVFRLLETLFEAFDQIANKHGVFKVETVSDCYGKFHDNYYRLRLSYSGDITGTLIVGHLLYLLLLFYTSRCYWNSTPTGKTRRNHGKICYRNIEKNGPPIQKARAHVWPRHW